MTSAETARSANDAATEPRPPGRLLGTRSRAATWDEERREVFESVLQAVRVRETDADRMAACAYLLRHLARTELAISYQLSAFSQSVSPWPKAER